MVGEQFDSVPDSFELKHWEQQISKTQFKEWSMVAISPNNDRSSVFPPINHENLHLPSSPSLSSSSSSSLSSFSPSDSDESALGPVSPRKSDTHVRESGEFRNWVGIGVEVVRSKLLGIASSVGWAKVWSFSSGASIVAVVFMLWSFYLRARQRRYRNHFKLIIKEKDEVSLLLILAYQVFDALPQLGLFLCVREKCQL